MTSLILAGAIFLAAMIFLAVWPFPYRLERDLPPSFSFRERRRL